jgi:hypothetical protein
MGSTPSRAPRLRLPQPVAPPTHPTTLSTKARLDPTANGYSRTDAAVSDDPVTTPLPLREGRLNAPPAQVADERTTLGAYLDFHRATLARKCFGLTDEQLRDRPVPPSTLSLLGLVRHLTDVERIWFANRFAERNVPMLYATEDDPEGDFENLDSADVAEVLTAWRAACAMSREIVAGASLDDVGVRGDGSKASLRWIMLRLIAEYARHNGHADLLRERLDGTTGE